MREKYFEDLGLDDGEEIFKKFKIDVEEILNNKAVEQSLEKKENDNNA